MCRQLIKSFTENYIEKLFYFCLKKTGNSAEAQDLASDITLNILTALHSGTIPEHFSAWVWQIARNRYSSWADKKHHRLNSIAFFDINDYDNLPDKSSINEPLETSLLHSEELSLLRRELAFISADYRQIVVAFYIDDKKAKDIAASCCVPIGTVLSKLSRARKILKEGMCMAREFGSRSYNPEDVNFFSSGSQPSGLPWKAVYRKIPKNILLEASNNPSTIEELAVELGIAVPYIEEEVNLLVQATLLKKVGDKFVTDFFILSRECSQEIYSIQRKSAAERNKMFDTVVSESLNKVRALGIAENHISDNTVKWWLMVYCADYYLDTLKGYDVSFPYTRENGENWGFVGYENIELPETVIMGHTGSGDESKAMFWTYQFRDYNLWQDPKILHDASYVTLLADILKNKRKPAALTDSEQIFWKGLNGEVAHLDAEGFAVPDILVIQRKNLEKIKEILKSHPLYTKIMENLQDAFDKTIQILKKYNTPHLNDQLIYCASMKILETRVMLIHDAVTLGSLTVPDSEHNTIGMWIEFE